MAQNADLERFLSRLTSRSVLSEREKDEIRDLPIYVEQVRPNTDFVRQGEKVHHACYVFEGLVGRFDQDVQGRRQITAFHIPGDMPDLHSVVQPTATSALQALSLSTILRVPHAAVRTVAARFPAIAEALWRDCMVDSMILAQWVVNVGRRDAKSRIAHLLCEMAFRYRAARGTCEVVFRLPVTQMQLGEATGLTAVHVNRTLCALRDAGVDVRSGIVRIRDWDRLVRIGDFDAGYLQADVAPERCIFAAASSPTPAASLPLGAATANHGGGETRLA